MAEMKDDGRLWSLDALRGLDMLLITGLSALIMSIVGGVCGHWDSWMVKTLNHAKWEGFNLMDTVFPLFMFISGIAFPYSYAKRVVRGDTRGQVLWKILWRTLALVGLGIVYNGFFTTVFAKGFAACRYPSVLARIGLAWGGATLFYVLFKWRTRLVLAAGILIGYWALLAFVPAPGSAPGADTFSLGGCFACWLDTKIFGWADPEGLLSTLPAIVTTMGGVFVGELVRSERFSGGRKTLLMLGAAVVSGLLAWGWSPFCPVVKKLWTSTFVLAAWSYSLACFAVFYWVIDVLRLRKWTVILRVIGVNSILIYFLRILVDFHKPANFFFHALAERIGGPWTAVIDNVAYILIVWLVMFFLYRKKVFWRV